MILVQNTMASSTKPVFTDFFKKSDTGDDQNTSNRSDLDQAIENVKTEGERDGTSRIFKE